MLTGNKGEWSEIYALFKLLSDKRLNVGDANLNIIEEIFYPIIKIIREESGVNYEYELKGDLVIVSGGKEEIKTSIKIFSEQAASLLIKMKGAKGTFSIEETEKFMQYINCTSLKAKSTSKTDIRIVIHDQKLNKSSELGFSIKSQIGSEATLLNAGKTTNFIYKINSYSPTQIEIDKINQIDTRSKIKDRLLYVQEAGGDLSFVNLEENVFKNNLILIDSLLPNILAEILLLFFTSKFSSIKDLADKIKEINPMNFDTSTHHNFYEYKIKRFLTDVALGMTPSKVWNGVYDATGGYLVVKENGDVLCYHIYNRNQFEEYLFVNTKLETASSSRHEFGRIYKKDTDYYFKLNLQVRFI